MDLVAPVFLVAEGLFGPLRLGAVLRLLGIRHLVGLLGPHLGLCVFAFLALGLLHVRFGGLGLRILVVLFTLLLLALGVLAVAGVVGGFVGVELVRQLQVAQDRARQLGERGLVLDVVLELGEILAGVLFDKGPPQ